MTTSTWQMIPDAGGNFRWELSSTEAPEPNQLHDSLPSSLPSFEDVLLQGCSLIVEDSGSDSDSGQSNVRRTPIVRTPSRNSVRLRKSSIAKASSLLSDDYGGNNHTGEQCGKGNGFSSPNSMFQTGSGKKVSVSSAGILRAKALLGVQDNDDNCTFQGFEPPKKKSDGNDRNGCGMPSREVVKNAVGTENSPLFAEVPFHSEINASGKESDSMLGGEFVQPEIYGSTTKMPPVKFHTAGGRSISVSNEALQRARSLLGDPDMDAFSNEGDAGASMFSFLRNGNADGNPFNRVNNTDSSVSRGTFERRQQNPQKFVSPVRSSFKRKHLGATAEAMDSGTNLISKFDAEASIQRSNGRASGVKGPSYEKTFVPDKTVQLSVSNGLGSDIHVLNRPSGEALADITNAMGIDSAAKKRTTLELKRLGRRSSVSPFKMPRSSKFSTPLNCNLSSAPTGESVQCLRGSGKILVAIQPNKPFIYSGPPNNVSEASYSRKRVSTRYPSQLSRTYVKEFFKVPPVHPNMEHIPEQVRLINPGNSEKYMFYDGSQWIGVEAFYHMLAQSGASMQHASKEYYDSNLPISSVAKLRWMWVANHYKWIVWKLASYERCYSAKLMKKFLTISNVLEELKYRYEREVNHGQHSSIKRILEGDASPSSMMVLCVSAACLAFESETPSANGTRKGSIAGVQLSDGWYSINAQLDVLLSKHLGSGKLFVGQKLRICGASLNGWNGPVSPLETSPTVSLLLHINGTYRANWADRLGFCRGACAPLAFRSIKSDGGPIPRTLVGVTRVYPVLYRERLRSGGFIVRSEKLEAAVAELYDQRRSNLIEGIVLDFQKSGNDSYIADDHDNEEGARILKMLESVAEPEFLMAEMRVEQLTSLTMYQAKLEARRQSDMQRVIEKALEDAGLHAREVTPFMRVRVVGLKSKVQNRGEDPREGLIRIWNPTEKQMLDLAEGQAYTISGLVPLHSDFNVLHLEARGSSTKWEPLTKNQEESFVPFFIPRKLVSLSRIGEVLLSSEFDTVGLVVHVGPEYIAGQQKKQWAFVTDGSLCHSQTEVSTITILAISFCSPCSENDTISPFNFNLVGSIVGFCNLVKRARDHANRMWVADATENATCYLNSDHPSCCHLKDAFALVKRWQQSSSKVK
ncbi:hypothetical protein Cgig2_006528 [Carnegiea gigantea]|uniref:Tower domain-containing protein n=1 Tax=Carnegiea gigantea TaxID=171969 RepID=A0A9Q1GVF6_9CARY|nr:hypothetical protein Cgig2_006528 [Carnegiea gigantea]